MTVCKASDLYCFSNPTVTGSWCVQGISTLGASSGPIGEQSLWLLKGGSLLGWDAELFLTKRDQNTQWDQDPPALNIQIKSELDSRFIGLEFRGGKDGGYHLTGRQDNTSHISLIPFFNSRPFSSLETKSTPGIWQLYFPKERNDFILPKRHEAKDSKKTIWDEKKTHRGPQWIQNLTGKAGILKHELETFQATELGFKPSF